MAQTNLYAQQLNANWEETTRDEIKAFLGMLSVMEIHKLPFQRDYWSQNSLLGVPGITKCMPRDPFFAILKHLHLNDNSRMAQRDQPNFDKLYKVRPPFSSHCEKEPKCLLPTSADGY